MTFLYLFLLNLLNNYSVNALKKISVGINNESHIRKENKLSKSNPGLKFFKNEHYWNS